jgi:hypothetical protein
MSQPTFSENDYYGMIEATLNQTHEADPFGTYPMDLVAGQQEWKRFKAALLRWLADMDAQHQEGFDNAALEEEYDG